MNATLYHASTHLDADQLIAAEKHCPACGGTSPRPRAGMIQRDPFVYLLRCAECGGCSASHMPTQQVLDDYYHRYFNGDGPRITLPPANGFADRLLRAISIPKSQSQVRVLDFGGGDGTLGISIAREWLAECEDRTVALTLVDYQVPAMESDERLTVIHRPKLEQVEGPFDLVLASAVLEHIPDLRPVIDRLFSLLAVNGWFYARTPYVVPLKRLLPNLDITYPGHVHDLGPAFWNRVAGTYRQPLRTVVSRPSLVETGFQQQPLRTMAAWLVKLPARLELAVSPSPRTPWWRLVGGWEVILQREPARQ